MTRIIGRRLGQVLVGAGLDSVFAAYPIPKDGILNNLFLEVSVMMPASETLSTDQMVAYGVSAFVVPLPDPAAGLTYDAAWDQLIPKDEGQLANLLPGTAAADSTAEFEPGEIDLNNLFDMVGLAPRQIFQRRKYLTVNDAIVLGGTPIDTYYVADHFTTQIRQTVRCNTMSYVLVGLSSPDMTRTGTIWDPPTNDEWAILQYLDIFIEQMFIASLGQGAGESMHDEAEIFITELLEDNIFETTADAFHAQTWRGFCRSTFDVSVPGRPQLKVLTSEGS